MILEASEATTDMKKMLYESLRRKPGWRFTARLTLATETETDADVRKPHENWILSKFNRLELKSGRFSESTDLWQRLCQEDLALASQNFQK